MTGKDGEGGIMRRLFSQNEKESSIFPFSLNVLNQRKSIFRYFEKTWLYPYLMAIYRKSKGWCG
jgi:hypothetical protein